MPTIVVKSKDGKKSYPLLEGKPLFIGRAKECDIVLATPAVSRRHAVILYKNGICGLKDLGSFNGTSVNGRILRQPAHLREEDVVKISSFTIQVTLRQPQTESPLAAFTLDAASEPAPEPPKNKSPKPDSRIFTHNLRLPRAMSVGDDVDELIQAIPTNASQRRQATGDGVPFVPEGRTEMYVRDDDGKAKKRVDVPDPDSPAATQYEIPKNLMEMRTSPNAPVEGGSSGNPNDTSYFEEAPFKELLRRRLLEQQEEAKLQAAAEKQQVSEETLKAEEIIPLLEPEAAPVLKLETDPVEENDATLSALEKLIEDSSPMAESPVLTMPPPDESESIPEIEEFPPLQLADAVSETDVVAPILDDAAAPAETEATAAAPADEGELDHFGEVPAKEGAAAASSRNTTRAFAATSFHHPAEGVDTIGISPALMAAINTRLGVYSLLFDLADERKALRLAHPGMPAELVKELDRQDSELDSLPTTEDAELGMNALRDRQEQEGIPSELHQAVDEMAFSQWLLVRDSNRETLPPIFKEAYKLAADEPLALELTRARIPHGRLFGGAIYLLALETLAESAEVEQKKVSTRIRKLSEEGTDKGKSSVLTKLGKLGRLANNFKNRTEIKLETAKLEDESRVNMLRASLAAREIAFLEKGLIQEYKALYRDVALHFVAKEDPMPYSVRAFLRHGVIGFKTWWMRDDVRDFILTDCQENVVSSFERGTDVLNVLYVDEYLNAVARMECSPSPDERLAALDKAADEWKADRAFRRIVNAQSYNVLMEEMLADLSSRMDALDLESQQLEARMLELKNRPFSNKDNMFDLQTEHQAVAIRRGNLAKHIKRIEKEVVGSIIESVQDAEGRFRKGELRMASPEELIAREVESLIDVAKRLEGPRERFLPLVVRDNYSFKNETLNDRATVRVSLADCERLDPALFMSTIISAKKKVNRVELRAAPTVIVLPALGVGGFCSLPREGMEGGHLILPTCFSRENARKRLMANLLADFRWETSRSNAGRDVMNSDTLVGAFMRIRWEWRNEAKVKREKGLILNELTDQANWRRVYELYLADATTGCRQLFQRNPDCYFAIIGRFIDLPEGVRMLRKSGAEQGGEAVNS